jgi:hypothetical protein
MEGILGDFYFHCYFKLSLVNIDYTHSGIIEVKTKNPHTQVELKM